MSPGTTGRTNPGAQPPCCYPERVDGFTQGVIGAAAAQAFLSHRLGRWALLIGWGAGMLPDADFFLATAADPIRATITHRGFSHALVFIPVGALVAALPFFLAPSLRARWREVWRDVYLAALLGYATHGPLDALTLNGTQLLWPFADTRVAFDLIGIVDPIFTLALLAGVITCGITRRRRPVRIAWIAALGYLVFCGVQHERGENAQERLAAARGHDIVNGRMLPTPGNAFLYRSLYRDRSGMLHADAIHVGLWGGVTYRPGGSTPAFDPAAENIVPARAQRPAELRRDLARYEWYTDGFWARTPGEPEFIGDMRLSYDTAGFKALWGIEINLDDDTLPVRKRGRPRAEFDLGAFWREVTGRDPRHRPVP